MTNQSLLWAIRQERPEIDAEFVLEQHELPLYPGITVALVSSFKDKGVCFVPHPIKAYLNLSAEKQDEITDYGCLWLCRSETKLKAQVQEIYDRMIITKYGEAGPRDPLIKPRGITI